LAIGQDLKVLSALIKRAGKLIWLVVSTHLKNIGQLGGLFPIYGKIKNVPNHQLVMFIPSNMVIIGFDPSTYGKKSAVQRLKCFDWDPPLPSPNICLREWVLTHPHIIQNDGLKSQATVLDESCFGAPVNHVAPFQASQRPDLGSTSIFRPPLDRGIGAKRSKVGDV
jgi:hypothetical protein